MQVNRSFIYAGPNRRADVTVMECKLGFASKEKDAFAQLGGRAACEQLSALHPALTVKEPDDSLSLLHQLGDIYVRLCIALQCAAGHQVKDATVIKVIPPDSSQCWYEYEEPETGKGAGLLAGDAIGLILKTVNSSVSGAHGIKLEKSFLSERIEHYLLQAAEKAMPADCKAIYDAALEQGVPVLRMDRPPFRPTEGDFRLRYHGLLCVGHGCKQQTVDGTFCVNRSEASFALIDNRQALFQQLEKIGVPLPAGDVYNWCTGPARVGRHADRLGYPVFLRTSQRGGERFSGAAFADREAVMRAVRDIQPDHFPLLVQAMVPGDTVKVLVAGEKLIVCLIKNDRENTWKPITGIHPDLVALSLSLAKTFKVGMTLVTLVSSDLKAQPLAGKMAIVDVELAPRLDALFAPADEHLRGAASAFVQWMIPSSGARIPIAAVTGTNGKTTTCRMLEKIVSTSGLNTGLACSDGCYINDDRVTEFEDGTLLGHLTLLTNPGIEAAVLEATRGGAGSIGLGFDRCDVAVCLNVTADHLDDHIETHSVEALAEVKRSIVERATKAVVLNADDLHCANMMPYLTGRRIGLVSVHKSLSDIQSMHDKVDAMALLETENHSTWVVIYSGDERFAVLPVNDIPLAFGGAAEHNVINAMHAALAAHFMGIETQVVAEGLRRLPAAFSAVPGRLSFYRQLPFDVCMDYAHNPAGVKALCKFTDQLTVRGRRVICLSCSNNNSDAFIRETAAAAAGHFDHYICKNFGHLFQRTLEEGPRLLREGLLAAGVPTEAITCLEMEEEDAIDRILALGCEGDLMVIIGGKRRQQFWRQITDAGEAANTTAER